MSELIEKNCLHSFNVAKGEEAPEIGDVPPVTGVAHKHCNWDVPYKVTLQQALLDWTGAWKTSLPIN